MGIKWYVTVSEYPYTTYPPYCAGFAYVMSADVNRKLYEASGSVPFLWVDDVYVTGFLALQAGVRHTPMTLWQSYSFWRTIF
jgi:hypothetical protein